MTRRSHFRTLFIASLILLDACALILAFQSAYWTRFISPDFLAHFPATKGIPELGLYRQTLWALLPIWITVFFYLGLYRDLLLSAYDELVVVTKAIVLCALLTTAVTFSMRGVEYSRLTIALWGFYSIVFVYLLREVDKFLFRLLTQQMLGPKHVLVVGKGKAVQAIKEMVGRQPFIRTSYMESLPAQAAFNALVKKDRISEVLLIQGALSSAQILEHSRLCETIDLECKVLPDLLEMRRGEIIFNGFCGLPTFNIKPLSLHGSNYAMKRSFDVLVSLAILTIIGPLLLIISLLIRLDTPGPALFSQDRMGFRGRKFKLFKFRTMVSNADDYIEELKHLSDRSGPVFKMKNDPRVTRVGRWLRALSIDELPQILNVLRGDMSLVGPRPQVLWEAAHYDEHAKKRLRVMPGITGLWQVSGRAALSYEEMINLDIYYLENWSLGLDLKILIRTLPAIFAREGAY